MKKPRTYYWLRLGDSDDYCRYAEFEQLCGDMAESGVRGNLGRCGQPYGLGNAQFQGNNYISCYVGDLASSPMRTLTDREVRKLNAFLLAAQMNREKALQLVCGLNERIGPCVINTAALARVKLKTGVAMANLAGIKHARFKPLHSAVGGAMPNLDGIEHARLKHLSTNEARAKAIELKVAKGRLIVPVWADDIYLSVHGLGTGRRQITISGKTNAENEVWTDNSDNNWRKTDG